MPGPVEREDSREEAAPGDRPTESENLPAEENAEEATSQKDALNGMPHGAQAAHRIASAIHGMRDVLGAHDMVEGPMRGVIDKCKSMTDSMESHVRDNHTKLYSGKQGYKDLPTYDMGVGEEGGGERGTQPQTTAKSWDDDPEIAALKASIARDEAREKQLLGL